MKGELTFSKTFFSVIA